MKKILFAVFTLCFITGCANSVESDNETQTTDYESSQLVSVKYRDNAVDIGSSNFEALNTVGSSFVNGAWYDDNNDYMVINLSGTYYQYCSLPDSVWRSFKSTSSFGSYYNQAIKGDYDCRYNYVPNY